LAADNGAPGSAEVISREHPRGLQEFESAVFAKVAWRLVPLLFLGYFVAYLDRVNVGFAKLQMAGDLHYSDAVYGFGAGIFFIGYFLFELPSNLILTRVGARRWIARIMVTWGVVSSAFIFAGVMHWGPVARAFGCTDAEFSFYALRFLLGIAEAGFYPGVILYLTFWFPAARRAQMIAWFMTAIAVSNVIGSPISGAILQFLDGAQGLRGWQWLFLVEGIPSILLGIFILAVLPDRPESARWLSQKERDLIIDRVSADEIAKAELGQCHNVADIFMDLRVWVLALIYFCGVLAFYAVNFWMPTIIEEIGIDQGDYLKVGLLTMIPWGVAAIAMVAWARHSDRTGERRWHVFTGILIAIVGLLTLAFVGHAPVASIVGLTLVTTGLLCAITAYWSLPMAFLSGAAAAGGIAWINSLANLAGYFGPDLIGRIRDATGGDAKPAFLVLAAVAVLGAVLTFALPAIRPKASAAKAKEQPGALPGA
jgi:MFS family permease